MGTRNFHSENNTGIYAIEVPEEQDTDDWFWDDEVKATQSYVLEQLEDIKKADLVAENGSPSDELRSFPASIFGAVEGNYTKWNSFVKITLITRSGYYDGANLDYTIEYWDSDGYSYDTIEDMEISNTERKALESQARRLEREVAKAFKNATTPIKEVAGFSDGTAVYAKV